ncbi:MAG: HEPN domain-containing protein [Lachnospiraceae bacterium]|nr:HEPN domain-containing protein [Lachnospiraceae bacterium]
MEQLHKGTVNDLVNYRIETAKSDLQVVGVLMKEKQYRAANNRAYYAIYHAISAVHALDGKSYKRGIRRVNDYSERAD